MGVAIAFPTANLNVLDVDISRLSDKREGGWPKAPKEGIIGSLTRSLVSAIRAPLEKFNILAKPPIDPWVMSQNRFNILVTVRLEDKKTGRKFWVGNYHMPCAFYAPMVMTIHTE